MKIFRDISFNTSWKDIRFDLFVSEDIFKSEQKIFGTRASLIRYLTARATFNIVDNRDESPEISFNTLEEVVRKSKVKRVAVLSAHGDSENGVWYYAETREQEGYQGENPYITERHTINSWIREQEKRKYGALILHCCNEKEHKPKVKRIPIFYAEGNVGILPRYKTVFLEP